MHNVVLIEGDGIGPEIAGAVQRIVDASGVHINWIPAKAGLAALEETGSALPQATLDALEEHCLALKGPTTTPVGGGHRSVNVQLRKALGLFANVRNVRTLPGVKTRYENIDIVIVRENVEDTYGGIEYMQTPDVALGFKFITRAGSESVVRYAFEHAKAHGRKKVTCVHKANIHKMSDGLFLEVFREVAKEYPGIEADDLIVDNTCMQLVSRPERFDVAVMPNLYGDIVSDLCAGLIGGLGVAPGSNIGDKIAVFEAVHGSAPDIAGQGIANPTALLQSAVHMLRFMGEDDAATSIETALFDTLSAGEKTGDLGGSLNTASFTDAVISRVQRVSDSREVAKGRIKTELKTLNRPVHRSLVGADIFLRADAYPTVPKTVGAFTLTSCANRGNDVDANEPPNMTLVDWWRVRYQAAGDVTKEQVDALLAEIMPQVDWMQIERLYTHDGTPAFTK